MPKSYLNNVGENSFVNISLTCLLFVHVLRYGVIVRRVVGREVLWKKIGKSGGLKREERRGTHEWCVVHEERSQGKKSVQRNIRKVIKSQCHQQLVNGRGESYEGGASEGTNCIS